jgi:outer membrane lipoprotein-sorting protein
MARHDLRALIVIALLASTLVGSVHAADVDLASLMAELAAVKSGHTTFVEKRVSSALDRPVESSGELSFAAPDHFTRTTIKPRPQSIDVVGDDLTFTTDGRTRKTSLSTVPEAAAIVDAMRGTLTGDQARLERVFLTKLTGTRAQWWLDLTPRDGRLSASVVSIRIAGSGAHIATIDVFGADNDRTTTTLAP